MGCKSALGLVIIVSLLTPAALGGMIASVSGSNFWLDGPCTITRIEVDHSESGGGGWVKLIDGNGNEYGPWDADTSSSTWEVYPDEYFMAGSYRLVDSNRGSYEGNARIYGNYE